MRSGGVTGRPSRRTASNGRRVSWTTSPARDRGACRATSTSIVVRLRRGEPPAHTRRSGGSAPRRRPSRAAPARSRPRGRDGGVADGVDPAEPRMCSRPARTRPSIAPDESGSARSCGARDQPVLRRRRAPRSWRQRRRGAARGASDVDPSRRWQRRKEAAALGCRTLTAEAHRHRIVHPRRPRAGADGTELVQLRRDLVTVQGLHERLAGAEDAAHDRPALAAQGVGGLRVGQAGDVGGDEDVAVDLGERADRGEDLGLLGAQRRVLALAGARLGRGVELDAGDAAARPRGGGRCGGGASRRACSAARESPLSSRGRRRICS